MDELFFDIIGVSEEIEQMKKKMQFIKVQRILCKFTPKKKGKYKVGIQMYKTNMKEVKSNKERIEGSFVGALPIEALLLYKVGGGESGM